MTGSLEYGQYYAIASVYLTAAQINIIKWNRSSIEKRETSIQLFLDGASTLGFPLAGTRYNVSTLVIRSPDSSISEKKKKKKATTSRGPVRKKKLGKGTAFVTSFTPLL
jgi:hypothetical protein